MTDLQSSLNPNNNLGTEQVTPVPTNDTGIDLSSTVEPNTVTPPAEVGSPVSSAPINSGVTLTATPNTSVSAAANQFLQNNKQTQPVDSINNPVQAPTPE